MRVSVLQDQFAIALKNVIKAVPTKSTVPVLSNIYLFTEDARLYIAATDLELSIMTWIGCKVDLHGSITLPAKTLSDLISNLSPDRVDIQVDYETQTANIRCGTTNTNIKGISGNEYPSLPKMEEPSFMLPAQILKQRLGEVVFCTAKEMARPVLTGVLFDMASDCITLAAADGYRLATTQIPVEAVPTRTMLVPNRVIEKLMSAIGDEEEIGVQIFRTNNGENIMFHLSNMAISMWLLDGKFPDFRAILPKSWNTQVEAYTEDLLNAAKRAEIFARDSSFSVRLFVRQSGTQERPSELEIVGRSQERGEAQTAMDCGARGEDLEVAINVTYLKDILNSMDAETVSFESNGSTHPLVVYAPNTQYVIMPMSLNR